MEQHLDFTLKQYETLLRALLSAGFECCTVDRFVSNAPSGKTVILRHDIDKRPDNAVKTAQIETRLHIEASYYFRAIDSVFDPIIIKQIADLGHEIGYHYEELSLCCGDIACAIELFKKNLVEFRKITPVKTICMHGSPLSKWDNRDLWKTYDYKDYGIKAEPYFDMDFDALFYLTDTGRRWDGDKVSVRDKVTRSRHVRGYESLRFRSTMDIIRASDEGRLPDKIMITTHPQRWDDRFFPWVKELVWQNVKNVGKRLVVKGLRC